MTTSAERVSTTRVAGLATVVLPTAAPAPVVLIRTPYDATAHLPEAHSWSEHGFAVVLQDVHGRYGSRGAGPFTPYSREAVDGVRTLDWVLDQSWCDGQVVAHGASYAAHCALALALARPHQVAAVSVAVPALGLGETARSRGGVRRLACRAGWWAEHGDTPVSRGPRLEQALRHDPALLAHLPVTGLPDRLRIALPGWPGLLAAHRDDAGRAASVAQLPMPLLAVGGLRDTFCADTLDLWQAWGTRTGAPARLLLGPWGHRLRGARRGELTARWVHTALGDRLTPGHRGAVGLSTAGPAGSIAGPGPVEAWHVLHTAPTSTAQHTLRSAGSASFVANPISGHGRAVLSTVLPVDGDVIGTPRVRLAGRADTPRPHWAVRLRCMGTELAYGIAYGTTRGTEVELTPLAVQLRAGHRVDVEVSGYDFPRHLRDPGTGQDEAEATWLAPSHRELDSTGTHLLLPAPRRSDERHTAEDAREALLT